MARIFILFTVLLNCGLQAGTSQAQLRGYAAPPAGREPARVGLLGGLRDAREERFRREEQAATAAARAAAQRNSVANPSAPGNSSAKLPLSNTANSNTLRRESNPQSVAAARAASNSRAANYGSPNLQAANRHLSGADAVNPNFNNSLLRPSSVSAASANALVPNPLRYDGPGVAIRLPKDSPDVVNYLLDDVENNAIRPGEQQVLDSKGSYIVRYSRGVTVDGRSFGESRYTITEGRYRFELTETGWELYRESDFEMPVAPANRLNFSEGQVAGRPFKDLPIPEFESKSRHILPTESLATEQPIASEPVASEEVLPAPKPRSILE